MTARQLWKLKQDRNISPIRLQARLRALVSFATEVVGYKSGIARNSRRLLLYGEQEHRDTLIGYAKRVVEIQAEEVCARAFAETSPQSIRIKLPALPTARVAGSR